MAETCSNIGPMTICLNKQDNNIDMVFATNARSIEIKNSSVGHIKKYEKIYKNIAKKYLGEKFKLEMDYRHAYIATNGSDELADTFVKGYKLSNITTKKSYEIGGLETYEWDKYNPKLNIVSIGAHLENLHNYKETLYVDTIKPLVVAFIHTIQNIK